VTVKPDADARVHGANPPGLCAPTAGRPPDAASARPRGASVQRICPSP